MCGVWQSRGVKDGTENFPRTRMPLPLVSISQPPFCFCASSLAAAGGGCSGHFFSAIAVVANDADANEASIEAFGDGARHS